MVVLLVPLLKAANRTNYTIEAFSSFTQHAFLLPSWIADQLLWSHYINTYGSLARIPYDLHMEHLNRDLKTAIRHLGANKLKKELFNLESASLPCQTHVVIMTYIWNVWLPPVCFIWQGPQHILSELQRLSPVYDTYPRPLPQSSHGNANEKKPYYATWPSTVEKIKKECLKQGPKSTVECLFLLLEVWLMLQHQDSFHEIINKWHI